MIPFRAILALAVILLAVNAAARGRPESGVIPDLSNSEILSSETQSVVPTCRDSHCDLEDFTFRLDRYVVHLPNINHFGTRVFARYKTKGVEQLNRFGLVQFIKGCQFTSMMTGSGLTKVQDVDIDLAGQIVPYHFTDFVIDGLVRDPLDWGDNPHPKSRHDYYKWNSTPGSLDPATAHWVAQSPPENPFLYVTDLPGTAFYDPESKSARNISVQFKTCVYKANEVPKDVDPTQIQFGAEPLACVDWMSSWIYDFKSSTMTSPASLDPFCR